jgi:hypothetical protein
VKRQPCWFAKEIRRAVTVCHSICSATKMLSCLLMVADALAQQQTAIATATLGIGSGQGGLDATAGCGFIAMQAQERWCNFRFCLGFRACVAVQGFVVKLVVYCPLLQVVRCMWYAAAAPRVALMACCLQWQWSVCTNLLCGSQLAILAL